LKNALLAAPLSIANGTLGYLGTPVGNHWHRGLKHYILYCLENDNLQTASISLVSTEWIVFVWFIKYVVTRATVCVTIEPKLKNFLPFLKLMKRPQTKLHAHTMRESHVIRPKKVKISIRSKFIVGSNFSCNTAFSLLINILLKLQQQISIWFCKFSCNSVIIMGWLQFLTKQCCFTRYLTVEYYVR